VAPLGNERSKDLSGTLILESVASVAKKVEPALLIVLNRISEVRLWVVGYGLYKYDARECFGDASSGEECGWYQFANL